MWYAATVFGVTSTADLVARSGALKRELIDFARQPRYGRALNQVLLSQGVNPLVAGDEQMVLMLDHFALEHRLPDGERVVDKFVQARPDLTAREREMLLGWRDVVDGVFEHQGREGDTIITCNLVDDLTYRIQTSAGPQMTQRLANSAFLRARVVPVDDIWLISGPSALLGKRDRQQSLRMAAHLATSRPELTFRNPGRLARGWELQHAERRRFIDFFGSDEVVLPGAQVGRRVQEFHAHHHPGGPPMLIDPDGDLLGRETVGVIYDAEEGMNFYADYGLLLEIFADPALLGDRDNRRLLQEYLDDDEISPLPLRRLAARDPSRASLVYQKVLRRKDFDWVRDGEALMRKHKAWFFELPVLPGVTPLSDRLASVYRSGG